LCRDFFWCGYDIPIKKAKMDDHSVRSVRLNEVNVFAMAFDAGLLKERMQITRLR